MALNRYSQVGPARYTPRTLEEMMIAPSYLRQQHDQLDAAYAAADTALAQADNDPLHSDVVSRKQQELYDSINQQANDLSERGFDSSSRSKFLRFNKDYQQAIGPSGIIGQAIDYKTSKAANREASIQQFIAEGYPPEQAARMWNEHVITEEAKYDGKTITNLDKIYATEFIDLDEDIDKAISLAGSNTISNARDLGYHVGVDPKTEMLVFKTDSRQTLDADNLKNLEDAQKMLNDNWLKESGKGYQSNIIQRMDPEYIADRINNRLNIAKVTQTQDHRSSTYQFKNNPAMQPDPNGRPTNFLRDYIQGYNMSDIDSNSPILALDNVESIRYGDDGNILPQESKYLNYDDKVESYRNDFGYNMVSYNPQLGIYEAMSYNHNTDRMDVIPILRESQDIKTMTDNIRNNNPLFKDYTDREMVGVLENYKKNLTATYLESIDPINSDYQKVNTVLFGNRAGKGEKGSGTFQNKGATINGSQISSDQVVKSLGYKSVEDFKTEGKPVVRGYVKTMGSYQVAVTDNKGNSQNIFVEAPAELNELFSKTQSISQAMLEAKPFQKIGADYTTMDDGSVKLLNAYMINDFDGDPIVVYSEDPNIKYPNELINYDDYLQGRRINVKPNSGETQKQANTRKSTYSRLSRDEELAAGTNSFYRELSGIKPETK